MVSTKVLGRAWRSRYLPEERRKTPAGNEVCALLDQIKSFRVRLGVLEGHADGGELIQPGTQTGIGLMERKTA